MYYKYRLFLGQCTYMLTPDGSTSYTAQNASSSASCVETSCNGAKLCSRRSTVTRRDAVEDEQLSESAVRKDQPSASRGMMFRRMRATWETFHPHLKNQIIYGDTACKTRHPTLSSI